MLDSSQQEINTSFFNMRIALLSCHPLIATRHKLSQVYLTRGRLVGRIHFSIDSGLRSFILFFSGGLTYYPQTDENKLKQEYPSCGMCKTWQIRPDTSWRHTSKQIVNNVSFASQYDWVLEKQDPGRVDTCQDLGK